ncbi:MAG TPA: hypothetical protein VMW70_15240 [Burkholderiales bacterium]|nr:hypothetical protein [Burkholderiales bacterium]
MKSMHPVVSTIAVVTLLFATSAVAQQKYSYSHSTAPQSSRYIQQHIIDVGDVSGHQIRILEVQRKYTQDHPVIGGVKVIESMVHGFTDYTSGVGPAEGYSTWILEDGNRIYLKWTGTSYTEATSTGAQEGTYNGTTYIVGGTGKFATIRGVLTENSDFNNDPDNGYNHSSSRGDYWFAE